MIVQNTWISSAFRTTYKKVSVLQLFFRTIIFCQMLYFSPLFSLSLLITSSPFLLIIDNRCGEKEGRERETEERRRRRKRTLCPRGKRRGGEEKHFLLVCAYICTVCVREMRGRWAAVSTEQTHSKIKRALLDRQLCGLLFPSREVKKCFFF